MRLQVTLKMVLIKTATLGLALMALFSTSSCGDKQEVIARIKFSAGGEILLLRDYYYENAEKYYYQVTTNGETRVPVTFMCAGSDSNKLRFELVPGKQGDVFAIIEHQRPSDVLMLYDSRSGESWPRGLPSDSFEDKRTKGLEMLKQLQEEKPEPVLKLSDLECG